jgi:hypothetical protein
MGISRLTCGIKGEVCLVSKAKPNQAFASAALATPCGRAGGRDRWIVEPLPHEMNSSSRESFILSRMAHNRSFEREILS